MNDKSQTRDLYDILGVSRDSEEEDIKEAYRQLSFRHHPDLGGDEDVMAEINEAFRILGDEALRAEYDATGKVAKEENSDFQKANEMLTETFQMMGEAGLFRNPAVNIKELMVNVLTEAQTKSSQVISEQKNHIAFFKKLKERIVRVNEGVNVFAVYLDHYIDTCNKKIDQEKEHIRVSTVALEELENYRGVESLGNQTFGQTHSLITDSRH